MPSRGVAFLLLERHAWRPTTGRLSNSGKKRSPTWRLAQAGRWERSFDGEEIADYMRSPGVAAPNVSGTRESRASAVGEIPSWRVHSSWLCMAVVMKGGSGS